MTSFKYPENTAGYFEFNSGSDTGDQLNDLLWEVFAYTSSLYAANLAIKGNLKLAEEVIAPISEKLNNTKAMDLHARILAQQKRYNEALSLWKHALTIEPESIIFRDALELCLQYCKLKDIDYIS